LGFNPIENIIIKVNKNDYLKAVEIIKDSAYKEFLANA